MRQDRERKRLEEIAARAPGRVGFNLVMAVALGAAHFVWSGWFLHLLLALQLCFVIMEAISWIDARRDLARVGSAAPPPTRLRVHVPAREVVEDPDAGIIEWREDAERWCQDLMVDGEAVEVSFNGTRHQGPTPAAIQMWLVVRPEVDRLWALVVDFTRDWAREGGASFDATDFAMVGITVTPDRPLDGGDLVVSFEVATDPEGTYMVPLRAGTPLLVHRDS